MDLSPTDVTLNLTFFSGRLITFPSAFTNAFESVNRVPPAPFPSFSVSSTNSSSSPGFKVDENFKIESSVNEKLISSPFLIKVLPSS